MHSSSRRHAAFCAAIVGLLVVCQTATTLGQYTQVLPPRVPGEDDHQAILSHIYGGAFSVPQEGSYDFTNGSVLAQRIEDLLPTASEDDGVLEMTGTGGDGTDQFWNANFTIASAEAKFAAFNQSFGYFDGTQGGTFQRLFDLEGEGYDVEGFADLSRLAGRTIRWGRTGSDRTLSSKNSDNEDLVDHLVTYQIFQDPSNEGGFGEVATWLVFWEDLFLSENSDRDFNDFVIEIKAVAIPEPSMLSLLSLGLAGLARRRRA